MQDYGNPLKTRALPGGKITEFKFAADVVSDAWLKRREAKSIIEDGIRVLEIDLQGSSVHEFLSDEQRRREKLPKSTKPNPADAQATQPSAHVLRDSGTKSATTHQRPVAPSFVAAETARVEHAHLRRHRHHGRP